MPYTISDWFREHAQVRVRVPAPEGSGRTWYECWLPYSVFDEGALSPEWMGERTWTGHEAFDFIARIAASEEQ